MPVAAVILAAGLSSRMGGANKLLAGLDGKPVVRHTVENVLASRAGPVVVVTGHQAGAIGELLQDLPVSVCFNKNYADGMATSLAAGIGAVPGDAPGALMFLGDMPLIGSPIIDMLIDAFEAGETGSGQTIAVPVHEGRRGHPVLWGRVHFAALQALSGDQGGRGLLAGHASEIIECEVSDDAIFADADTPEALAQLRSGLDH